MFVSKQEVHNDPDRERLRQFCPRHDPRCLGVDLSDPYNPKTVWDYDKPKAVAPAPQPAQAPAPRPVDLTLVKVETPDYSKLSWTALKALCKRKGIPVAKTSRADLEARLGAL